MRNLRSHAEALCRALAPDVAHWPFYVVLPADLPPEYQTRDSTCGWTQRYLSLVLRPELERLGRWRGRGPAMVIDPGVIAAEAARRPRTARRRVFGSAAMGVVLHELAHILEMWPVEEDPPAISVDMCRLSLTAELSGNEGPTNGPNAAIPWRWHEWKFIRIALHLTHRAASRGLELTPADVFNASDHGLSSSRRYTAALGDEPERLADRDFAAIGTTMPPAAFAELWRADLQAWQSRYPTKDDFRMALAGCERRILIPKEGLC